MTTEDRKIKMLLIDEFGQMPLKLNMNGGKFRWDVFKMACEMSHPKSLEQILETSKKIIDWVNDEQPNTELLNTK